MRRWPNTDALLDAYLTRRNQGKHDPLVQSERFALLHFDAFFVQAFHGVHFARVRLSAAVNFSESSTANNSVD